MDLANFIIIAPPILLALTIHEYAHGMAAYKLGDDTAYQAGRLTLNPLSHLDPIGTIALFLVHIGWAKPVPVNPYNLRNPRTDLIWVSAAGPGANIAIAFISGMLIRFLPFRPLILDHSITGILLTMLVYSVVINLVLAFFNLIPIPPLDGSKILGGFLKGRAAYNYARFEQYGPFLLMAVLAAGFMFNIPILWWFLGPFVSVFSVLFTGMDLSGI